MPLRWMRDAKATTLLAVAFLVANLLPAQKMPVADRILQLIDLRPIGLEGEAQAAAAAARSTGVDVFVRRFVEPALGPDDDVRLLGRHHLAVLGSAQHVAWVENLVARGVEHRRHAINVQVRLFDLSAAFFDQQVRALVAGKDAKEPDALVQGNLEKTAWVTLMRRCKDQEGCLNVQSGVLCVQSLASANLRLGADIAYVADYVHDPAAKGHVPQSKTVLDGQVIDLTAAFLGNDRIALHCEVTHSVVQKPLAEAKVSLGEGAPLTIEVPRCRVANCERSTVLENGGATAIATRRADGTWLLAAFTVQSVEMGGK